ncbi:MAG: aldo/keto reductase [Phycisphaeraceae bacterium]|nr:aldo/keto reductase [Phycisphaeraceae bacterium]
MDARTLGRTGLDVTVLGYGAMEIRDATRVSDDEADRLLNAVLDGGINFIDTAPCYGLSEQRIGRSIAHRRSEYFLATKCGCNVPRDDSPDAPRHIWTRQRLMANIELSLKRLQCDYVDIWQLHNASVAEVDEGDLVRAMEDVTKQGKVRHVSISSTVPHIATYVDRGRFDTYQIPYSALQRDEEDSITRAAQSGAGTIIRGGVAKGDPGNDTWRDIWQIWNTARLDDLLDPGENRYDFTLRFTITHPHMHTTIVGTKSLDHLAANIETVERRGVLSDEVYEEAKRRLDRVMR